MPIREKALIAEVRRMAATRITEGRKSDSLRSHSGIKSRLRLGIGDDCAILKLPAGHETLVTTDFSLEGIHFRREWHPAASVGHRCLVRGLSDIAAMGGAPVAAFLSLALPADLPQRWVRDFMKGFITLAETFGVNLAGGDTAQSPNGILADIVVVGAVPNRKAVLRSGARPGDRIYVSGELGGSAAVIQEMRRNPRHKLDPKYYPRHFYPEPRLALGKILRQRSIASAMIDTSDGLSTDLAHICEESGVGAEMRAEAIPRAILGKAVAKVDLQLALHGGEDYELLFTAPPDRFLPSSLAGVRITPIGHITRTKKIVLIDHSVRKQLKPGGWEHFKAR